LNKSVCGVAQSARAGTRIRVWQQILSDPSSGVITKVGAVGSAGQVRARPVCDQCNFLWASMPSGGSIALNRRLSLFLALFFFTRCCSIPVGPVLSLASFFRISSFFPLHSLGRFPSLIRPPLIATLSLSLPTRPLVAVSLTRLS